MPTFRETALQVFKDRGVPMTAASLNRMKDDEICKLTGLPHPKLIESITGCKLLEGERTLPLTPKTCPFKDKTSSHMRAACNATNPERSKKTILSSAVSKSRKGEQRKREQKKREERILFDCDTDCGTLLCLGKHKYKPSLKKLEAPNDVVWTNKIIRIELHKLIMPRGKRVIELKSSRGFTRVNLAQQLVKEIQARARKGDIEDKGIVSIIYDEDRGMFSTDADFC